MLAGAEALAAVAPTADVVVNGVVGFAGLGVTLATLRGRSPPGPGQQGVPHRRRAGGAAGAGHARGRARPGRQRALRVHQCLRANAAGDPDGLARIVLTASGGPFRGRRAAELADVTVDDALAHPTWSMGPKITVDSSTLMNKGLEVIEAHELFGVGYDRIDVVVHPQSIVHSMVEFTDGATIAQLSMPDMRLPIGYALAYPDRLDVPFGRIDWSALGRLDFEPPDLDAFPCLGLAYDAGRLGRDRPGVAQRRQRGRGRRRSSRAGLRWSAIPDVLEAVLARHDGAAADQRRRRGRGRPAGPDARPAGSSTKKATAV